MTSVRLPAQNAAREEIRAEPPKLASTDANSAIRSGDFNSDPVADFIELAENEVPESARELAANVIAASCEVLEIGEPELHWFDLDDGSGRDIAFTDSAVWGRAIRGLNQIWLWRGLATDLRQLGLTTAHEVGHIGGHIAEDAADEFARRLLERAKRAGTGPRTVDELIGNLTELTGVSPEQAKRTLWALEDEEWDRQRLVQARVDRAEGLARSIRHARQQSDGLGKTWSWLIAQRSPGLQRQAAGVYDQRLACIAAEREFRQELDELLLHDQELTVQVLRAAGAPTRPPSILGGAV